MGSVSLSASSYSWAPALDDDHNGRLDEPEWADMRPQDATHVINCSVSYSDKKSDAACDLEVVPPRLSPFSSTGASPLEVRLISPPTRELSVKQAAEFAASLSEKQLAHVFQNAADGPAHKAELSPALYAALEKKGRNAPAIYADALSAMMTDVLRNAGLSLPSSRDAYIRERAADARGWISALPSAQGAKVEAELKAKHPEIAKLLV